MNYTPVLDYQIVYYNKYEGSYGIANTFVTDGKEALEDLWKYCAEFGADAIQVYNATGGGLYKRHLVAEFKAGDVNFPFVEKLEKAIMEYEGALK